MYVDESTIRSKSGKAYTRYLLRDSFRENGKVKHRTIANISSCKPEEIAAIRLALRHKHELQNLAARGDVRIEQGASVGAVFAVHQVAQRLGIVDALGNDRDGKRALWQVIARVIDQGSRLSAVRLAGSHAACDILGIEQTFHEDHLYDNLDWLCDRQATIEQRLFLARQTPAAERSNLFLYDVTSSYFEGTCNELSAFGYNRDGKRGKRQIVIGLLCDHAGLPVSVEVFTGNTNDAKTFLPQVHKAAERFGATEVTFVGDRGMIKGPQIAELSEDVHYITAITKPQIESLLQAGVIQMELFDEDLAEVTTDAGVRYVLRRNPVRVDELSAMRRDKQQSVERLVAEQNRYLAEHPRAAVTVAQRKVQAKLDRLKLSGWLAVTVAERTLTLVPDASALAEEAKLDGCYVLKTDLVASAVAKEIVHDRYKDLARVEWAFRTSKTGHLETRPIHVRLATRTRGHVLVVMLAYHIVAELAKCWQALDVTVAEGLARLSALCVMKVTFPNQTSCQQIPTPSAPVQQLLTAAAIRLPALLPSHGVTVTTKKKLPSRRST